MRAVAVSDKAVQGKVTDSFVPLKIVIPIGTEKFPLDWPGLKVWSDTYRRMGGQDRGNHRLLCPHPGQANRTRQHRFRFRVGDV